MKRFSRYVCMLLVVAMLLACPVFAQEEEVTPRSSAYFTAHLEYLYQVSSNRFEIWFEIRAKRIMDELGVSTIKVMRSPNGETDWTTMRTYSMDDYYSRMICENTGVHVGCVTYTGTIGYYYKAKITYYAKEGGSTGYYSVYTDVFQL